MGAEDSQSLGVRRECSSSTSAVQRTMRTAQKGRAELRALPLNNLHSTQDRTKAMATGPFGRDRPTAASERRHSCEAALPNFPVHSLAWLPYGLFARDLIGRAGRSGEWRQQSQAQGGCMIPPLPRLDDLSAPQGCSLWEQRQPEVRGVWIQTFNAKARCLAHKCG